MSDAAAPPQFLQRRDSFEVCEGVPGAGYSECGSVGGAGQLSSAPSSEDLRAMSPGLSSVGTRGSQEEITFDMEHFNQQLDSLADAEEGGEDGGGEQEEELVQLVTNILFTVLWRGRARGRREAGAGLAAAQGQAIASINMMALNNRLYTSHARLKRRLTELCLQAVLAELRAAGGHHTPELIGLARQCMQAAHDLVVLDDHEAFNKKVSVGLVDSVLGLLDCLAVFQEGGQPHTEWTEMAGMALDLLLVCAENSRDLEFCALATARLHTLVQTRAESGLLETGFLLQRVNRIIQQALASGNTDHYAFLVPIMKALLDKARPGLELSKQLPGLNLRNSGCQFFTEFQEYCETEEWEFFISRKVAPLHEQYQAAFLAGLPDSTNEYWAECYEEAQLAAGRWARETADSLARWGALYGEVGRGRAREEAARYQNLVTQQRSSLAAATKRWTANKRLHFGSRGAWAVAGEGEADHWQLGSSENSHRMRMRLIPNPVFDSHLEASQQRDNVRRSTDQADSLLRHQIAVAAVNTAGGEEEEEPDLTEDDLKTIAKEQMANAEEGGGAELEKFVAGEECELVTLMSVVKGRFELTTSFIYFFDSRPVREDEERQDNRWSISSILEVHLRRFNLRRSALEVFLTDRTNFFINFPSVKRRNRVFTKIVSQRPPSMVSYSAKSPRELLRSAGLTSKWVNREISNFEYLMHLNTIAGRTYNDLSQV